MPFPPLSRFLPRWFVSTFGLNILAFGMFAGIFHAALYYRDLERRRRRQADLEARLATAELNVLRMQLQSHLFFNTLHTISSLMVTDVDTAHRVISERTPSAFCRAGLKCRSSVRREREVRRSK